MRQVIIGAVLTIAMPAFAGAGVLESSWSRLSFVGGGGVAVQLNDDDFQEFWKEAVYSTLNVEAEVFNNLAVYGSYDKQTFDPVANAGVDPINVTNFGAGVIAFGSMNATGSVRAYLDLGFGGNVTNGFDKTWTFQPGGGLDINLDHTGQSGLRLGGKWRNYDDEPDKVQAVLFQALLRVSPGK